MLWDSALTSYGISYQQCGCRPYKEIKKGLKGDNEKKECDEKYYAG